MAMYALSFTPPNCVRISTRQEETVAWKYSQLVASPRFSSRIYAGGAKFEASYSRRRGGRRVRPGPAGGNSGRVKQENKSSVEESPNVKSQVKDAPSDSEIVATATNNAQDLTGNLTRQSNGSTTAAAPAAKPVTSVGSFRAGQKRPEVAIPSLILRIGSDEILRSDGHFSKLLDSAVAGGVTIVILDAGDGVDQTGGAALFEAACSLKSLLRGRAQLLVGERADIAAAAGADGVLLSDRGLPAVVARRMMESAQAMAASSDASVSVLPMVARSVDSVDAAMAATAADGADFLLLSHPGSSLPSLASTLAAVHSQVSIPIVCQVQAPDSTRSSALLRLLNTHGLSGLAMAAREVPSSGTRDYAKAVLESIRGGSSVTKQQKGSSSSKSSSSEDAKSAGASSSVSSSPTSSPDLASVALEAAAQALVVQEQVVLDDLLALLREATPQMAEVTVLEDALKQLTDLFLLVIVGEFNSGKSSVVNALLGNKFLREGVVPTTNEITLLKQLKQGEGERVEAEYSERHPDGHFVRFLPAPLLSHMNIVDTPGTNVILERQQRLTEEFVPRADLVMFVLSADRPLTESEVSFLRYIRQWGKKVVFLLNKADVLTAPEVAEVLSFVSSNVKRLLSVEAVQCFPVSARKAMAAKLTATSTPVNNTANNDSYFPSSPSSSSSSPAASASLDMAALRQDSRWQTSGFPALESFLHGFLEGSSDLGAERLRLKLGTPLGVGAALLAAAERQLAGEASQAANDLQRLQSIRDTAEGQREELRREAEKRQKQVKAVTEAVRQRCEAFVDSTLVPDNAPALLQYLLKSDAGSGGAQSLQARQLFAPRVVQDALTQLNTILSSRRSWLASQTEQQMQAHCQSAAARWPHLAASCSLTAAEELQALSGVGGSLATLGEFDVKAAAILLDEEFREAVYDVFKNIGASGVSAAVLTGILPTTTEDLVALLLCSLGGYSGLMKLPEKRAVIKSKISRAVEGFVTRLFNSMEAEVEQYLQTSEEALSVALRPYSEAAQAESSRVAQLQERAEKIRGQIKRLRQDVENLGC